MIYRKHLSLEHTKQVYIMNVLSGLSKECATRANAQFANVLQTKFLLSGNNNRNNRIRAWSATQSSTLKKTVLSLWENGALKMKTTIRLCM